MNINIINYCPKCGFAQPSVEQEPGQYSLLCRRCNFYCEIFVFDEGDLDGVFKDQSS